MKFKFHITLILTLFLMFRQFLVCTFQKHYRSTRIGPLIIHKILTSLPSGRETEPCKVERLNRKQPKDSGNGVNLLNLNVILFFSQTEIFFQNDQKGKSANVLTGTDSCKLIIKTFWRLNYFRAPVDFPNSKD